MHNFPSWLNNCLTFLSGRTKNIIFFGGGGAGGGGGGGFGAKQGEI